MIDFTKWFFNQSVLKLGILPSMPRWQKRFIQVVLDFVLLTGVALLALHIQFSSWNVDYSSYLFHIFLLPLVAIPVFIRLGLYSAIVRYISGRFYAVILLSVSVAFLLWSLTLFILNSQYGLTTMIIAWMLTVLMVSGSRGLLRSLLLHREFINDARAVVIYGAGDSGLHLYRNLSSTKQKKVVAFIDDNEALWNRKIDSLRVYSKHDLQFLINHYDVKELLLAMPSLDYEKKHEIISWSESYPVKVMTVPTLENPSKPNKYASSVTELKIEDLLGRPPAILDKQRITESISGKNILITGSGGSIGSELSRQIAIINPKNLVLCELSEYALYTINKELEGLHLSVSTKVIPILGSAGDTAKMKAVITKYDIDTIFHAAAYKHVPIVEHNIKEGIINNAFVTFDFARAAAQLGVKHFTLISTDKAVRPTNFMGASKRMAELAIQSLQDQYPKAHFSIVRFGNVLGSSGSVIPLFRSQIANGGPVTVTHRDITRYFMTVGEAVSLTLQASTMPSKGAVFVLDMGEPVKIYDLALKMVRLSGFEPITVEYPEGDIAVKLTGLRPGEKLYEELLIDGNVCGTSHPKILQAAEQYVAYGELQKAFNQIQMSIEEQDLSRLQLEIADIVSGFKPEEQPVDFLMK